jgi:hypothetical protein
VRDGSLEVLHARWPVVEEDRRDVDADSIDVLLIREPTLPEKIGSPEEPLTLGLRQGRQSRQERALSTRTHLDDHDDRTEAREQIDLQSADPEILGQEGEAARDEVIRDEALGFATQVASQGVARVRPRQRRLGHAEARGRQSQVQGLFESHVFPLGEQHVPATEQSEG